MLDIIRVLNFEGLKLHYVVNNVLMDCSMMTTVLYIDSYLSRVPIRASQLI